mgnify:CR=1 FL=1
MVKVGEMGRVPRGYGLAYLDYARAEGIFYLIPFNLIVRIWLKCYWKIAYSFYPSWFRRKLQSEYERGWDEGREKGYGSGIEDGYAKRQKDERYSFLKWLDEQEKNEKL